MRLLVDDMLTTSHLTRIHLHFADATIPDNHFSASYWWHYSLQPFVCVLLIPIYLTTICLLPIDTNKSDDHLSDNHLVAPNWLQYTWQPFVYVLLMTSHLTTIRLGPLVTLHMTNICLRLIHDTTADNHLSVSFWWDYTWHSFVCVLYMTLHLTTICPCPFGDTTPDSNLSASYWWRYMSQLFIDATLPFACVLLMTVYLANIRLRLVHNITPYHIPVSFWCHYTW